MRVHARVRTCQCTRPATLRHALTHARRQPTRRAAHPASVADLPPPSFSGNLEDRLQLHASADLVSHQRGALLGRVRQVVFGGGAARNRREAAARVARAHGGLSWQHRLRIIRDATRGLHYLHTPCGPKSVVLHRDVKPTNILLDERLNAKLSDFGLAKHAREFTDSGQTHVTTNHLVGTPGYIDPLYSDSGRYDQKTDAYAMGISLLVCLVGESAVKAKEV